MDGRKWPAALLSGGFAVGLALLATARPALPRCPAGMVALGARCCGEGQSLGNGACVGAPNRCAEGLEVTGHGCVAPRRRVVVPGGDSSWRPPDDQVGSAGEHARVVTFALDVYEVTWAAYRACSSCAPVTPIAGGDPGQAAHGVTLNEARAYCRAHGGRLPRDAEWLRAAIGDVEKRYPWGDPDALCLRAAFSLVGGKCGDDAKGPDTAGSHPWGATPLGIQDLAGNVAEWVDEGGPPGQGVVRGGSFAETDASSLRARWRKVVDVGARQSWIGFRCAYDVIAAEPAPKHE